MKKLNVKGFTLIELLAVITIMGILMLVAIPTVSRTIENSRKDTFLDTVKQYTNSVKTMWAADNLSCGTGGYTSSAVWDGVFMVKIDTSESTNTIINGTAHPHPVLLEQGGKSPWGNRDIKGAIYVYVSEKNGSRSVEYFPVLTDGVHGINLSKSDSKGIFVSDKIGNWYKPNEPKLYPVDKLKRSDIVMSGASYGIVDFVFEAFPSSPSQYIYICDGDDTDEQCKTRGDYKMVTPCYET